MPHSAIGARIVIYRVAPDWKLTTVAVEDVRAWLASRGIRTGFFFPDATDTPDYLNPKHPRYAPRLAAAVNAWLAVTQASGKSVKNAIKKWLREHAAEFRLADDDGNPNETGIEEVAKVANWQPASGAPKTPELREDGGETLKGDAAYGSVIGGFGFDLSAWEVLDLCREEVGPLEEFTTATVRVDLLPVLAHPFGQLFRQSSPELRVTVQQVNLCLCVLQLKNGRKRQSTYMWQIV
ncbi:hypothetical protein [Paraburkholderia sp. J12]|uniref:hypothetical protein n=1 Tax=Paraburkholderia sp. J12 TaxID=2805432 RepID=UPI002ABE17A9|nr:hypothetical protein [Paraburkholderia sp. J12]